MELKKKSFTLSDELTLSCWGDDDDDDSSSTTESSCDCGVASRGQTAGMSEMGW